MKVWARVINGDRMSADTLHENDRSATPAGFRSTLQEVCYLLDVSTPVVLPAHFKHFLRFNRVKFLPRDFVETVDFTSLEIELVK